VTRRRRDDDQRKLRLRLPRQTGGPHRDEKKEAARKACRGQGVKASKAVDDRTLARLHRLAFAAQRRQADQEFIDMVREGELGGEATGSGPNSKGRPDGGPQGPRPVGAGASPACPPTRQPINLLGEGELPC